MTRNKIETYIEKVDAMNRDSIPPENESIYDDVYIKINNIQSIQAYKRSKESCPHNRGNWIIDIRFKDGELTCIKLPIQMSEDRFLKWFRPLIDDFKKSNNIP